MIPVSISTAPEVGALEVLLPDGMHFAAVAPIQVSAADLHPREALLVHDESPDRRRQFTAGRLCARQVLAELGGPPVALLRSPDGAPEWPREVRGSISHKSGLCVVVAGRASMFSGIGIDLEANRPLPDPVWGRVFTAAELDRLRVLPTAARTISARLGFSAKECYYKWYRSQGGTKEPDFGDVEVYGAGDTLRVQPLAGTRLPEAHGCLINGRNWLMTVLWSS